MNKTYTGKEVQAIIDIILEEADAAIDKSYKEGYKQAAVEIQPEVAYWRSLYEEYSCSGFANNIKFTLIGFGAGLLLGGTGGFAIGVKLPY